MRAIVERNLFRSARSSFFFLLSSSLFSTSLTQNRSLKLRFLQEEAVFQEGGPGNEMKKKKRTNVNKN